MAQESKEKLRPYDNRKLPITGLDFYPTAPGYTRMLMERLVEDVMVMDFGERKYVPENLVRRHCIEPAAGGGHMSEVLKEYFGHVWSFDIKDYGYPLDSEPFDFCNRLESQIAIRKNLIPTSGSWIITNPPFNRAEEFITTSLALGIKNIAILGRLQLLEGISRYENVFKDNPPNIIYVFSRRVQFSPGEIGGKYNGTMAFAWFVWLAGDTEQSVRWLPGKVEDFSQPMRK